MGPDLRGYLWFRHRTTQSRGVLISGVWCARPLYVYCYVYSFEQRNDVTQIIVTINSVFKVGKVGGRRDQSVAVNYEGNLSVFLHYEGNLSLLSLPQHCTPEATGVKFASQR